MDRAVIVLFTFCPGRKIEERLRQRYRPLFIINASSFLCLFAKCISVDYLHTVIRILVQLFSFVGRFYIVEIKIRWLLARIAKQKKIVNYLLK